MRPDIILPNDTRRLQERLATFKIEEFNKGRQCFFASQLGINNASYIETQDLRHDGTYLSSNDVSVVVQPEFDRMNFTSESLAKLNGIFPNLSNAAASYSGPPLKSSEEDYLRHRLLTQEDLDDFYKKINDRTFVDDMAKTKIAFPSSQFGLIYVREILKDDLDKSIRERYESVVESFERITGESSSEKKLDFLLSQERKQKLFIFKMLNTAIYNYLLYLYHNEFKLSGLESLELPEELECILSDISIELPPKKLPHILGFDDEKIFARKVSAEYIFTTEQASSEFTIDKLHNSKVELLSLLIPQFNSLKNNVSRMLLLCENALDIISFEEEITRYLNKDNSDDFQMYSIFNWNKLYTKLIQFLHFKFLGTNNGETPIMLEIGNINYRNQTCPLFIKTTDILSGKIYCLEVSVKLKNSSSYFRSSRLFQSSNDVNSSFFDLELVQARTPWIRDQDWETKNLRSDYERRISRLALFIEESDGLNVIFCSESTLSDLIFCFELFEKESTELTSDEKIVYDWFVKRFDLKPEADKTEIFAKLLKFYLSIQCEKKEVYKHEVFKVAKKLKLRENNQNREQKFFDYSDLPSQEQNREIMYVNPKPSVDGFDGNRAKKFK